MPVAKLSNAKFIYALACFIDYLVAGFLEVYGLMHFSEIDGYALIKRIKHYKNEYEVQYI